MKYGIYINQKAIIDNGWKIKANHCAILDVISNFIAVNQNRYTDESGDWYWISNKLILEAIPMFEISDRRVRQLIKDLADINLLEINQNNDILGRCYLRLGKSYPKYTDFEIKNNVDFCTPPEKNFIAPPEKNFRGPLKKISTYNIINNNKIKYINIYEFFLSHLEDSFYENLYKKYMDIRGTIEQFIISNKNNHFELATWKIILDEFICENPNIAYLGLITDEALVSVIDKCCNPIYLKIF